MDMAPILFAKGILAGESIKVFNIGNSQPLGLLHFIEVMEQALGW